MKKPLGIRFDQGSLEVELKRLQKTSGVGVDLKVVWAPDTRNALSGEVKGDTIYVYEKDEPKAVEILWHEFLDYCVSKAIKPYREVTNKLIALINEEAYKKKEKVIETLIKLLKALDKGVEDG